MAKYWLKKITKSEEKILKHNLFILSAPLCIPLSNDEICQNALTYLPSIITAIN